LKKFVVVLLFLLPMIILAQDEKGTLDSYRVAAKRGDPVAEFNVGLIFYEGRGVPKDYEKALKWFRLASKKGHPAAQYYLGLSFDKGIGVKKDPRKAEKWYRLSAEQGYVHAQEAPQQEAPQQKAPQQEAVIPKVSSGPSIRSDQTQNRGGLLYKGKSEKPYTGMVIDRDDNGVKEKHYVNGKRHGPSIAWGANGAMQSKGTYVNGQTHGLFTYWLASGEKSEANYVDGKRDGTGMSWYDTGEKWGEYSPDYNVRYYRNGNKSRESRTRDAAQKINLVTEWYENGNKKSEGIYKGGYRQGLWTEYHENGQKQSEATRLLDDRAELGALNNWSRVYWSEWYESGQRKAEGFYVNYRAPYTRNAQGRPFTPSRHGYWRDWDPDGNETSSCYHVGSRRPDLRSCQRQQVLDKVGQVAALLNGAAMLTGDTGGFSGQAGDRAVDLGMGRKGQSVLIGDANFLSAATAVADEVSFSIWIKRYDVANSSVMWADSPSSQSTHRGVQMLVPWEDNAVYFDTAGCCSEGDSRIKADIATFPPYTGSTQWWNEWHHFVFSKKGTHKEIWIDGQRFLEGENSKPLPSDFVQIWLGNLAGHREIPNRYRQFRGLLDDYSVFGTALGAQDIARLAAGDAPTTLGDSARILAYWDFNELGPLIVPNDIPPSLITR